MKHFFIVFILALIITSLLSGYNPFHLKEENNTIQLPFDKLRKITANPGVVGCLSEESFKKYSQSSLSNNFAEVKNLIDTGLCIFFMKDHEIMTRSNVCDMNKKNEETFPSIPQGSKSEFFMPCFAIR